MSATPPKPTRALRRVAYHEAGHAVAAWRVGVRVRGATIRATEHYAGRVTLAKLPKGQGPLEHRSGGPFRA